MAVCGSTDCGFITQRTRFSGCWQLRRRSYVRRPKKIRGGPTMPCAPLIPGIVWQEPQLFMAITSFAALRVAAGVDRHRRGHLFRPRSETERSRRAQPESSEVYGEWFIAKVLQTSQKNGGMPAQTRPTACTMAPTKIPVKRHEIFPRRRPSAFFRLRVRTDCASSGRRRSRRRPRRPEIRPKRSQNRMRTPSGDRGPQDCRFRCAQACVEIRKQVKPCTPKPRRRRLRQTKALGARSEATGR